MGLDNVVRDNADKIEHAFANVSNQVLDLFKENPGGGIGFPERNQKQLSALDINNDGVLSFGDIFAKADNNRDGKLNFKDFDRNRDGHLDLGDIVGDINGNGRVGVDDLLAFGKHHFGSDAKPGLANSEPRHEEHHESGGLLGKIVKGVGHVIGEVAEEVRHYAEPLLMTAGAGVGGMLGNPQAGAAIGRVVGDAVDGD